MSRNDARPGTGEFDPSGPGSSGTLWGLPFGVEDASLVVVPVPWEATVSYGTGAADGPASILEASVQVDLYDSKRPHAWKRGMAMAPIPTDLRVESDRARERAMRVIEAVGSGKDAGGSEDLDAVNAACKQMVARVRAETASLLDRGKLVAVLGGDHSTALGLMQSLAERVGGYGILHIDAHCDLRKAYEGFVHSHASIMYNALQLKEVERLVQVGIRDYSEEEHALVEEKSGRVCLFEDRLLARRRFSGETWLDITKDILSGLPEKVYVSFDIDGLDPSLCPDTGTPVPGGLRYEEALALVEGVVDGGRSIIGFDLCEVAPSKDDGEWNANVGARVLYRLCCTAMPREG